MKTPARFGKNISLSVGDMDILDTIPNIEIPVMLLQIYVENALEKGIRPAPVPGNLTIEVTIQPDILHICIADDGKGRVADPFQDFSIKSSTKVMEELVNLFNRYNTQPLVIQYEDFWLPADANYATPHGTKVHFFIPNNYHYAI